MIARLLLAGSICFLSGCLGGRPAIIAAKHPPPKEWQCTYWLDRPEENCGANWWRWLEARVHIYELSEEGKQQWLKNKK